MTRSGAGFNVTINGVLYRDPPVIETVTLGTAGARRVKVIVHVGGFSFFLFGKRRPIGGRLVWFYPNQMTS